MTTILLDRSQALRQTDGGYIAPRADLDPSQRCFVALNSAFLVIGFIQEFADGTVAYWRELMQPGKLAGSRDEAYKQLALS